MCPYRPLFRTHAGSTRSSTDAKSCHSNSHELQALMRYCARGRTHYYAPPKLETVKLLKKSDVRVNTPHSELLPLTSFFRNSKALSAFCFIEARRHFCLRVKQDIIRFFSYNHYRTLSNIRFESDVVDLLPFCSPRFFDAKISPELPVNLLD